MTDPLDLPALRAVTVRDAAPLWVMALIRDALAQHKAEMSANDEFDARPGHNLSDEEWEAARKWLDMPLASACERLAEENERLVGEIDCACNALTDSIIASGNDARTNLHWVAKLRRVITPAPAGKAGDMSTGLTIDSSAPAGK